MKIGMLFPAYGSQYVGMGKELYDNSRIVQEYFEEASHCLDINFVKLCFASSDIELSKISHAYPALFLVSTSTAAYIKQFGIKIDYVAGHGIGEYGALCTASGLSFPDGLYLLSKLSKFYTEIRENLDIKSVLVNGISSRKLNQLCKDHSSDDCQAHISVYENQKEHVVTGNTQAIDLLIQDLKLNSNIKNFDLEEGLHSPLLNQLLDQIKIYLTKVDFKDLSIPLISSISAKEICNAKKAQIALINQIVKPIYWQNVIKQFGMMDVIIVPAPSKYLVTELKSVYPDKQIIGVDTMADIEVLKNLANQIAEQEPVNSSVEEETAL